MLGIRVAASEDTVVAESLLRVAHLIDPSNQLNNPKLLLRIATVSARHLFVKLRDPQPKPSRPLAHAVAPTQMNSITETLQGR